MNKGLAEIVQLPDKVMDSATKCRSRYINASIQSIDMGFMAIEELLWRINDSEMVELLERISPLIEEFNRSVQLRTKFIN